MGFSSGTSTRWLYVHFFQVVLEFGVLFFVEGGKPGNPEKNPRSRNENQQQTQPTCDARSGNRTRATAVGGERSHNCAIPAPRQTKDEFLKGYVQERITESSSLGTSQSEVKHSQLSYHWELSEVGTIHNSKYCQ